MRRGLPLVLLVFAPLLADAGGIGTKLPDFALTDLDGNTAAVALSSGITVVTFFSTRCPVSNDYNERMNRVYADYGARGVRFFFADANANEPAEEVRAHAKQAGFSFPVFRDANSAAADRLGAGLTPETFVIDASGVLRYRGSIDDSRNPARVLNSGLRSALDAVLSGEKVERTETKAFGCTIKRAKGAL